MNANCCKRGAIARTGEVERRLTRHFFGAAGITVLFAVAVASCTSSPRYRPAPRPADSEDSAIETPSPGGSDAPAATSNDANALVEHARSFVGTPYRTGGASRNGMDCSGLVMTVYKDFHIDLPRRSIDQSRVGRTVPRGDVEPGDLVFFKTSSRNPVTHVGIYLGNHRFIHASTSAHRVRIDSLDSDYFRRRFVVAKRVID